ncbi:hypothetical protein F2Q68_00010717 [Brassica cretica]|uniref:Uncharacterized protein n=1 Tax=Brassica cretica TaxID=69181 RepID=A0A8S9KKQ0_BRACR|nr:hypothetical protein F2Q68_00010717 [Brassica cretica]
MKFRGKLRAEAIVLKLRASNRRASKNVMLPKRPSHQSKTLSNHGRADYSTHGSPTITSSTTSLISDCCGLLQVNRETGDGLRDPSLSGAVAWASDSESLFMEPSGVL